MKINDFIKGIVKLFGDGVEYKATSDKGQVFKTENYDEKDPENQEWKQRRRNQATW